MTGVNLANNSGFGMHFIFPPLTTPSTVGGAIFAGDATLVNCTLSNNTARGNRTIAKLFQLGVVRFSLLRLSQSSIQHLVATVLLGVSAFVLS